MTDAENFSENRLHKQTDLVKRLYGWGSERLKNLPPKVSEANARFRIVQSAEEDLKTSGRLGVETFGLRFIQIINELEIRGFSDEKPLSSGKRKDSITGETFFTRIRKDGDFLVAEEVGEEGRIISQSRISESGQTELTLHFKGERYEKYEGASANPGISRSPDFPRASLDTFELLTLTFKPTKN